MAFDITRIPGGLAFSKWWSGVSPDRKRIFLIAGIFGFILAASALIKNDRQPAKPIQQAAPKLDMTVVTSPRKDEGVPELRAKVETSNTQISSLTARLEDVTKQLAQLKEANLQHQSAQVGELTRELQGMKEEVRSYKSDILSGPSAARNLPLPPLPPPPKEEVAAPPPVKVPKIRIIGREAEESRVVQTALGQPVTTPAATAQSAQGSTTAPSSQQKIAQVKTLAAGNPDISDKLMQYIPAGTIINGILLNGIDAPTSGLAQKQPVPALMRVKTLAFLPNRITQDIRECHIILSGYGVLSSERANLRTETISCVRNDGGVVETSLNGYAVGADGKQGLRGELVTKQGALVARSLVAGFVSGFANVMKPSMVPGLATSPGNQQQWQGPDMSAAMTSSTLSGIGQAANDVARFFLDTAKEMHPVVEIPSETPVTVILVQGASLAVGQAKPSALLSHR